jgi:hypothetical protein
LALAQIRKHPNKNDVGILDNCAVRVNEILNAAGVRTNGIPFPSGTARDVQSLPGAKTYYYSQGGNMPDALRQAVNRFNQDR